MNRKESILLELKMFRDFFDKILRCRNENKRGVTNVFNADFSMVFPHVWRQSPSGVPEYKQYGKNLIDLISKHPGVHPGFELYFTLPSFLELLDSFHHHARNADDLLRRSKLYDEYQTYISGSGVIDSPSITRSIAEKNLDKIKHAVNKKHIKDALERAKQLIGVNGSIYGINDILNADLHYKKQHVKTFNTLLDKMLKNRSFDDSRDEMDKEFHYKVDVSNIITTIIFNELKGFDSHFVTQQKMITRYCPDWGVNATVPFLWFSSYLLCHRDPDTNGQHDFYLKVINRKIKESIEIIEKYGEDSIPKNFRNDVDLLHLNYLVPLHENNPRVARVNEVDSKNDGVATFESYIDFKKKIEEAREHTGEAVKELVAESSFLMESDVMDIFNFKEDPVVQEIRKDFGV